MVFFALHSTLVAGRYVGSVEQVGKDGSNRMLYRHQQSNVVWKSLPRQCTLPFLSPLDGPPQVIQWRVSATSSVFRQGRANRHTQIT